MIIDPVPPIHSDITIVIDDSCNSCCCLPWIKSKSPTKKKVEEVAKEIIPPKKICEG